MAAQRVQNGRGDLVVEVGCVEESSCVATIFLHLCGLVSEEFSQQDTSLQTQDENRDAMSFEPFGEAADMRRTADMVGPFNDEESSVGRVHEAPEPVIPSSGCHCQRAACLSWGSRR